MSPAAQHRHDPGAVPFHLPPPTRPRLARPAPDWSRAACRGLSPDLFYPHPGDAYTATQARAVCAVCSIRAECLTYALDACETLGIWGGMTERERARERRARRLTESEAL